MIPVPIQNHWPIVFGRESPQYIRMGSEKQGRWAYYITRNVSNDQMTKFWKADSGEERALVLNGPVNEADFAPSQAIRGWEYGTDDEVRRATSVSLKRNSPKVYELRADTDVSISFPSQQAEISNDAATWKPLSEAMISPNQFQNGPIFLRIK